MPRIGTKPKTKAPGTGLARPGDPLVTGKGQVVEPENKPSTVPTSMQELIDPAKYRPKKKRNIKEIPGEPRIITAVGAVFMYTMLGVGDREICDTLGIGISELNRIRDHSAYGECFQIVHSDFINSSSDLLSSRIASYSHAALETVGNLITGAKKDEVKFAASKDMLDRAGVRPKDQQERAMMESNDLRIIIVDGAKSDTDLSIDIEGVEDGDRG